MTQIATWHDQLLALHQWCVGGRGKSHIYTSNFFSSAPSGGLYLWPRQSRLSINMALMRTHQRATYLHQLLLLMDKCIMIENHRADAVSLRISQFAHSVRLLPMSFQLVDSTVPLDSWNDLFIARRVSSSAPATQVLLHNLDKAACFSRVSTVRSSAARVAMHGT